jgi:transposase InsO family protein
MQKDNNLKTKIVDIHTKSRKIYGTRRVHAQLERNGERCGHKKIVRLMNVLGLKSCTVKRKRKTTNSNHKFAIQENILNRNFQAQHKDQVWCSDISYIWTQEGWLYLAIVIDLFSRKIVGWSMESHMRTSLVLQALQMAQEQRENSHLSTTHHSDRGSQYASKEYQLKLSQYGVSGSMSRKGNCWDNAVAESFFHTIKSEHVCFQNFENRAHAKRSIFEWIECFYNRERLHSSLGFATPEEYVKTVYRKVA